VSVALTIAAAGYEVIVLEGCDGTGKTTLANMLATGHRYAVVHSGRTPNDVDLVERYRSILAIRGKIVLDRSFISELVYGPLDHGQSRLTTLEAAELALRVKARGGVLVHLTGAPETIFTRLRARDGSAPPIERVRALIEAYRNAFATLADTAPIITVNTTVATSLFRAPSDAARAS
jgi:thymidylate kinase